MKKGIRFLTALCVTAWLFLFTGVSGAQDYTWTGGDYAVPDNATTLTLSGSSSGVITIPASVTTLYIDGGGTPFTNTRIVTASGHPGIALTIHNLDITAPPSGPGNGPGIAFTAGDNRLLLSGTNKVMALENYAGISVLSGVSLTIDNASASTAGSLETEGGTGQAGAAGIGGNASTSGGTITIVGGTITATGGGGLGGSGAGIGGGGSSSSAGIVTIKGGSIVATGGGSAPYDIGPGQTNGTGTVTITGGSVNPTRWTNNNDFTGMRIFDPQNAKGTSLVQQTYTGAVDAKISFGVNDSPAPKVPYIYTFTVPNPAPAYLWLPSGAALPANDSDIANITLTIMAAAQPSGIELSATPATATGYIWQRSTAASGPFTDLANKTASTYVDTSALNGTTYYYRVMPIVAGKIPAANPYSAVAPATMPWLTNLSISAGTLNFASATTTYSINVANGVTSTTVTPTTDTPGATITVNGTGVASGSPSHSIVLNEGSNTITVVVGVGTASKTYTITITRAGSGPGPDPVDEKKELSTLLTTLNTALSPKASVTGLSSIPAAVGTPITKVTPSNATFAKKDAPTTALSGYAALAPSFSSSVALGSGTTGNTLALKYTINVSTLSGFENWGTMTDAQRVALLDSLKVIFAYEYADKTWKTLVGAGGVLSWADALKAGIATFSATGLSLNYAVTDATGDPTANGSVMVIPDGAKDNKIVDPVWLMKASTTPVSDDVKIDLSGLGLVNNMLEIAPGETVDLQIETDPAGATFTATGLPQGLTLTSDGHLSGTVPQIGTYTVTVTATLNGQTVSETFTIEVTEKGVRGSSSSGGCDAGLGGLAGVALAALAAAGKRRKGA